VDPIIQTGHHQTVVIATVLNRGELPLTQLVVAMQVVARQVVVAMVVAPHLDSAI